MRHARAEDLDQLEDLLVQLRVLTGTSGLTERSRGVFYRGSKAYLHFHQDPTGFFADLRLSGADEFERVPVTSAKDRSVLLRRVKADVKT